MRVVLFNMSVKDNNFIFDESLKLAKDLSCDIAGIATLEPEEADGTFEGLPILF